MREREKKKEGRGKEEKQTEEDRMKTVLVMWDSLRCPQISITLTTISQNIDFSCGPNGPKASFPLRPSWSAAVSSRWASIVLPAQCQSSLLWTLLLSYYRLPAFKRKLPPAYRPKHGNSLFKVHLNILSSTEQSLI